MITKTNAIQSLRPNAQWVMRGDELEWLDTTTTAPSNLEIQAEISRLQAAYDATQYQRDRAREYPPAADYLDAVVKGDQAQMQAYIDACLAVKAKYPKPSDQ